jgi:hypothetical protein
MNKKKMVKRKVICVYGKFDNKSDFVLEPACESGCEECDRRAFFIQSVEE